MDLSPTIVWFRRDLRLADNPALKAATAAGPVIPVYVWAPEEEGDWQPGGAQRWWLHESLCALAQALAGKGSRLLVRRGPSLDALGALVRETGAGTVCWNRLYEPAAASRDRQVADGLLASGVEVRHFKAGLLWEPQEIATASGTPYRVFTPYWRACLRAPAPSAPLAAPRFLRAPAEWPDGEAVEALALQPQSDWHHGLARSWQPGEAGARTRLDTFLESPLADYAEGRDLPAREGVSRLSPHLHFGEISPRALWTAVSARQPDPDAATGVESYLRELGWREFAHHVLHHFPHTATAPLNPRFADFPWREDAGADLRAWQRGRTGIPLVDAAMRQLWETGWMHNRVRMVVASLLVKNLRIHWLEGARWFWDTLVDADLANNTLGWQWSAGCGADAAPFFRIFNPVRQGERFDPDGEYVRRYVPELAALPARYIHRPWKLPARECRRLEFVPGEDYPEPLVDLADSRGEALAVFRALGGGTPTTPDRSTPNR